MSFSHHRYSVWPKFSRLPGARPKRHLCERTTAARPERPDPERIRPILPRLVRVATHGRRWTTGPVTLLCSSRTATSSAANREDRSKLELAALRIEIETSAQAATPPRGESALDREMPI